MNLIPVIDKPEASYEYVTNDGPITYLVTQKSAPNYRLVAIDIKNPKEVSFDFLSIFKFKSYLYESLSLRYFGKSMKVLFVFREKLRVFCTSFCSVFASFKSLSAKL
jgi:hypothetical protein